MKHVPYFSLLTKQSPKQNCIKRNESRMKAKSLLSHLRNPVAKYEVWQPNSRIDARAVELPYALSRTTMFDWF